MNTKRENNLARLRVLVAIASYGRKNFHFLQQLIQNYQGMPFSADLFVFSEAHKCLGRDVNVIVGLPSRNPWTLPFAHKMLFAQSVDDYDLFIYSEDDIAITERNISAFLEATSCLESHEIAGFLRYEIDPSGTWFLDEPWGHFHWKPESVKQRGPYTIAEFTNEHAGFYVLTRTQLKRAIASGGFLRGPCRGRYNWPETAATDPYTNCGFRKVICISSIDDFLVHHMPNCYLKQLDVSLRSFKDQIRTLTDIRDGIHPSHTLFRVESSLLPGLWQKSYYERPNEHVLEHIPLRAQRILSIGCGWGATEERLLQRGAHVTAIPLDSVIGAVAARRGVEIIHGTWDTCLVALDRLRFDCILITNLLHLQHDPGDLIRYSRHFLAEHGSILLAGPNFDRFPWWIRRTLRLGTFAKLRSYHSSGISICGPLTLVDCIRSVGLRITRISWLDHAFAALHAYGDHLRLGRLTARSWLLRACRDPSTSSLSSGR